MPDRDPADGQVVTLGGQAGRVHDLGGDLAPFRVGQEPVAGRGADGAVPDRLVVVRPDGGGQGLGQESGEAAEVGAAVGEAGGLQFGGFTEACDQVRVGVLVRAAGAVQIAQEPPRVRTADHLANQPRLPGDAACPCGIGMR
jgi:hypothetical protein